MHIEFLTAANLHISVEGRQRKAEGRGQLAVGNPKNKRQKAERRGFRKQKAEDSWQIRKIEGRPTEGRRLKAEGKQLAVGKEKTEQQKADFHWQLTKPAMPWYIAIASAIAPGHCHQLSPFHTISTRRFNTVKTTKYLLYFATFAHSKLN